jgi:hypothetical protein
MMRVTNSGKPGPLKNYCAGLSGARDAEAANPDPAAKAQRVHASA